MSKRSFGLAGTRNDPRDSWAISDEYTLANGQTAKKDDTVELVGGGKWVFIKYVVTEKSEWVDLIGSGAYGHFKSVKGSQIRRVVGK